MTCLTGQRFQRRANASREHPGEIRKTRGRRDALGWQAREDDRCERHEEKSRRDAEQKRGHDKGPRIDVGRVVRAHEEHGGKAITVVELRV